MRTAKYRDKGENPSFRDKAEKSSFLRCREGVSLEYSFVFVFDDILLNPEDISSYVRAQFAAKTSNYFEDLSLSISGHRSKSEDDRIVYKNGLDEVKISNLIPPIKPIKLFIYLDRNFHRDVAIFENPQDYEVNVGRVAAKLRRDDSRAGRVVSRGGMR